jgi:hypothetical protein
MSTEVVLNNYFENAENDPTVGYINYPFKELPEGKYSLELKAYDNLDNSSVALTEFIISESAELAIEHLLNYPNPFTTSTSFYFEQNQSKPIEYLIQIFTISGKEIKSFKNIHDGSSNKVGPILWDGKDEFGDPIGRGVYIYKLTVQFGDQSESVLNKLVILK